MMEIFISFLILIVGFVALILGADWLVDGASGLAKRYNVPDLVIGLTIVAFGTSAPELVVNLMAAFSGSSQIALTNILGSNSINVFIILGISAAICPIPSTKSSRQFYIPMAILAGMLILLFGTECFGLFKCDPCVSRWEGVVLLLVFAVFMWYSVREAKHGENKSEESYKPMSVWKALLLMVVGIAGLVIGGDFIVDSATKIANSFGVPESVIGVTIVALGTSLPELATSAVAAFKKNTDLALGNVIGSNIFNVFFVLGLSAVIKPLPAYDNILVDSLMATICCVLVWLFVSTNKKHEVKRWQGWILLLCYTIYLVWLLSTL